jgi:hypothetical protein
MDNSQNNGASAPPADEQVQRGEGAAVGGNPVEGNPSAGNVAPQVHTQTEQNTPQGNAATPLETGLRQRGDAEKQRAAEAKAAREVALANINKERRQKRLRSTQELNECLGSGMDLLTLEQVGQITEAAGNEPRDALRSFGEVEGPQGPESSCQRGRPQGGGQGCRASNDRQIKRAAAERGYSASGGRV